MKQSKNGLQHRLSFLATSFILCCIVTSTPDDLQSFKYHASNLFVQAYSLNTTISEKGCALQYNSHLDEYDPDNETSGVPVIMGLLYMQNPNDTIEKESDDTDDGTAQTEEEPDYVYPRWTKQNVLRVCLQYWDDSKKNDTNFTIYQVRWILNYTFPMKFANWTPQVALHKDGYLEEDNIKDWCSRGAFWGGILEANGNNRTHNEYLDNLTKKGYSVYSNTQPGRTNDDDDDDDDDDNRRRFLFELPPEADQGWFYTFKSKIKQKLFGEPEPELPTKQHRFLNTGNAEAAAQAPKAGDKGPADDDDADVAQKESEAEAIAQASGEDGAELPEPLFGIYTLEMTSDLEQQVSNVSFMMPFKANATWMMDIDWQSKDYKMMINWGVFKDENDTGYDNKTNIYGAEYMRDMIDWKFKEPKGTVQNAIVFSSVLVMSVLLTTL